MRRAVDVVDHPDPVERVDHPSLEGLAAHPEVGRAERDVLAHRRHEQLVVRVLEHHADPAPDLHEVLAATGSPDTRDGPAPAVRIR